MIALKKKMGIVALGMAAALVCSCGGEGTDSMENPTGGGTDVVNPPSGNPTGGDDASLESIITALEQIPEHPPTMKLEADPAVSPPDGEVTFTTEIPSFSGHLFLLKPDGTRIEGLFSEGRGSLNLSGLADGFYPVVAEEADGGALGFGSVRVSSSPGIWLSADRRYVAPGEKVGLRVDTIDLPLSEDNTILTSLLTGELSLPAEWESGDLYDLHLRGLVPSDSGELVPGVRFGTSVEKFTGRTLLLEPTQAETYHVAAILDSDLEEPDVSKGDAWLSNPVTIRVCSQPGTLSGNAGTVGTLRVLPLENGGGIFYQDTQDGNFQMELPAGRALILLPDDGDSVVVDIPCGGSATLPSSSVSTLAVASEVQVQAQAAGGSGQRDCRTIFVSSVDSSVAQIPGELVTKMMSTSLHNGLSRASVTDALTVQQMLGDLAQRQLTGEAEDGEDQVAFSKIREITGDLLVRGRIEATKDRTFIVFAGIDQKRARLVAGEARNYTGDSSGLTEALESAIAEFTQEMAGAGVCASVDPEESELRPSESVDLALRATDLAGTELQEGDVQISAPSCGNLDPQTGTVASGAFDTTYTANDDAACNERIEFNVSHPDGVATEPGDVVATIDLLPRWDFGLSLNVEDQMTQAYQWKGTFTVEEARIEGSGSGTLQADSECEVHVNGVLKGTYPYSFTGTFDFDLTGQQARKEWGDEFQFEVLGYNTQIDMQYPEECGEDLFRDFTEAMLAMIAEYPQYFVNQTSPPTIPVPAADGGSATYPVDTSTFEISVAIPASEQ